MERAAFTHMLATEGKWWNRGRAYVVRHALARLTVKRFSRTLDYGAGFGGMYETLHDVSDHVDAFEMDAEARSVAKTHGYEHVYESETEAYTHRYDLIGLFDVLEHIEDDAGYLKRTVHALANEGRLAITVPAMPILWTNRDVEHHHCRRYTHRTLQAVLEGAGYSIEYMRYWNVALFIPAYIAHKFGETGEASFTSSKLIDQALYLMIVIETHIMRFLRLPFGVSLVVLARKR